MSKGERAKDLFTASDVARFCQVDLKTIHNWAERGEVRHFRTPGRHLRFRRVDVLDFLRRYGYPIPEVLLRGRPRAVVVESDESCLASLRTTLEEHFDIRTYSDPVDALVAIGADPPDVVVLDASIPEIDGVRIVERLKASEMTRHIRSVVFGSGASDPRRALEAGASAHVVGSADELERTLSALMGLPRSHGWEPRTR